MKEFVGSRADDVETLVSRAKPAGRRHDGAVAMFHPVAERVRKIIGNECVRAAFIRRQLAEHRGLFADDALEVGGEAVSLAIAAGVMEGNAKRLLHAGARALLGLKGTQREIARLDWAIDEVGEIGSRE